MLHHAPGCVGPCASALEAICSKLLEESLIPKIIQIGMHDDVAVRLAVVVALSRSRCRVDQANAFLFCCQSDEQLNVSEAAEAIRKEFSLVTINSIIGEIELFLSTPSTTFREMVRFFSN